MGAIRTATIMVGGMWLPLLAACPGSLENPERFLTGHPCDYVVDEILSDTSNSGCARVGCHGVANPQQGLDLASDDLIGRLSDEKASAACVAQLWIDTSSPSRSLLYTKLTDNPPCGSRMPVGPALPAEDVACVLGWLEWQLGAPDAGAADAVAVETDGATDAGFATDATDALADAGEANDAGVDGGEADAAGNPDADMPVPMPLVRYVEAEAADSIRAPFAARSDSAASGNMFVSQTTGMLNDDPSRTDVGLLTFNFSLSMAGETSFWARVRAARIDTNSFWVRVDDRPWVKYNDFPTGNASFEWSQIFDRDNDFQAMVYDLDVGDHVLEVLYREPNAELDRVFISQDMNEVPTN